MFGGINAVFAGLAFAGVIYAIKLQSEELAMQRQELKFTRTEIARSAKAQEESEKALSEQAKATEFMAQAAQATLREMRETRIQDASPHVIVYFDITPKSMLFLVIKNIGKSTALDTRLNFTPELQVSDLKRLDNLTLLNEDISSIIPDYE